MKGISSSSPLFFIILPIRGETNRAKPLLCCTQQALRRGPPGPVVSDPLRTAALRKWTPVCVRTNLLAAAAAALPQAHQWRRWTTQTAGAVTALFGKAAGSPKLPLAVFAFLSCRPVQPRSPAEGNEARSWRTHAHVRRRFALSRIKELLRRCFVFSSAPRQQPQRSRAVITHWVSQRTATMQTVIFEG